MKTERAFPKVSISSKAARSLKNGHPWVYGDEIISVEKDYIYHLYDQPGQNVNDVTI